MKTLIQMPDGQTEYIKIAQAEAVASKAEGGVENGAVLVKQDEVVSQSRDRTRQLNDPIAIAEMDCIRRAGRRLDYADMTLYSTAVPNLLIAGTLLQFGVQNLVIGQPASTTAGVKLLQSKNVSVNFIHD